MTLRERRQRLLEKSLRHLERRLAELAGLQNRFAWYRLLVFLAGLGTSIALYWVAEWASWSMLLLAILAFNIVAYYHRRVDRSLQKHSIWRDIKTTQLARMTLDWEQLPEPAPSSEHPPDHPFNIDLDLTGRHSLQQLLDIAISREGSQRLREWLLATVPDEAQIRRRQRVVRELAGLPGFRDQLLLNTRRVSAEPLEGNRFLERLRQPRPTAKLSWLLPLLLGVAATTLLLLALRYLAGIPPFWILSFSFYALIYFANQTTLKHIFNDTLFLEDELSKLKALLRFLEGYPYPPESALGKHCAPFWAAETRPSQELKQINRVIFAIGLRMNPVMTLLLNIAFPWDFYVARRLERSKAELAALLPQWIDRWAALEALVSLANHAWLNPEMTFPELSGKVGEGLAPVFRARELSHPLLLPDQKVSNDITFEHVGEMVLITGSNMAGKSTFLKTLGINLVLAYAGGAVDARQLETALFRLFTCIKVSDSVTDGFSYFYAEVRRLKRLLAALEEAQSYPLFYLIDEIFKGTNNRERYLGSRAYIRTLAGKRGVGAISTHDLELTQLAEDIPQLANYHFREEVHDRRMVFDYRLRPGPSPTTNALIIMEMEGLPVSPAEKG